MNFIDSTDRRIGRSINRLKRQRKLVRKIRFSRAKQTFFEPVEYVHAPSHNLLYTVNSKAACTSIVASMLELECGEPLDKEVNVHKAADALRLKSVKLAKDYPRYYCFTVVRNPVERLLSCYKNKFLDAEWRRNGKFHFSQYLGGIFSPYDSFDAFLDKVCDIPDELADRHFISQYTQLIIRTPFVHNYIGEFERLQQTYEDALQGLRADTPTQHNISRPVRPDQILITRSALDKIYYRYKKDIEYFGYDADFQRRWEECS